jgi:5-oxoprolinase (ATP-hydrolysing)
VTNARAADDRDRRWRVWIDTGGTFTDCLALDPGGHLHRAKVLSSGVLRATIVARHDGTTLELDQAWGRLDGFLDGARAHIVGSSAPPVPVVASTANPSIVKLGSDPGAAARPGARCEILTGLEAPVVATHVITATPLAQPLPPLQLRLGTTRGTNALLERRGARTVLVTTDGFGDVLGIGTQQRDDLFALEIVRPEPLHAAVVEVDERLAADGTVLQALDEQHLRREAERLAEAGFRSAAVAFVNAWREPHHERQAAAILRTAGFDLVAESADLAPLIGFLERVETTVVEAYLAPVLETYLAGVRGAVNSGTIQIMTSAGGLVGVEGFRACDALLSGPAGGVVGAALAARRSGSDRVLALDMGGTSTDVSRWAGDYEYVFEHRVGDARLVVPALAIETVAAGGGSICHCDAGRLAVGPVSAGADPGPACYGADGPLTLTDVNLLLGRLVPDRFGIPVDREAAARALGKLRRDLETAAASTPSADEELLDGLLRIADERMAAAMQRISVRHGYDPSDHTLVAFGGAGPQHACAVAGLLGVRSILVPRDASLLSAAGLGHAVVERFEQRQVLRPLHEVAPVLEPLIAELERAAIDRVVAEGVDRTRVRVRRCLVHLRLAGQDTTLEVEWRRGSDLAIEFGIAYRKLYGYAPPDRPTEVESVKVVASSPSEAVVPAPPPPARPATPASRHRMYIAGGWRHVPFLERTDLEPGMRIEGPALVVEDHSATVVCPGWGLAVDGADALRIDREGAG